MSLGLPKTGLDLATNIILLKLPFKSALHLGSMLMRRNGFVESAQSDFGDLRALTCFNNRWKFLSQNILQHFRLFLLSLFFLAKNKFLWIKNWFRNVFLLSKKKFHNIMHELCFYGFIDGVWCLRIFNSFFEYPHKRGRKTALQSAPWRAVEFLFPCSQTVRLRIKLLPDNYGT